MPRRRRAEVREVAPDPIFGSTLVEKFVNSMMWDGRKAVAQKVFYGAMTKIGEKANGEESLKIFKKAVENCKPMLEVKTRRVGGANYQVPIEVHQERRGALAIRWIVSYARGRGEKTMTDRLAAEILDAANNRGNSVKKKEDTHRMADANKAFAHYKF